MAHRTDIDVRFAELDPYGHVNHVVYLTYFEVARTVALKEWGLPIHEVAARGYQFVVTNIDVRYRRAAVADDTVTVETSLGQIRRASTVWEQTVLRGDEVLVTATITIGVTDRTGKPCKPPDWLFAQLPTPA